MFVPLENHEGGCCTNGPKQSLPGLCFALGWWLLADAATYARQTDDPQQIGFWQVVPGLVGTLGFWLLTAIPRQQLTLTTGIQSRQAKCALFLGLVLQFSCLMIAMWLLVHEYTSARSLYPGIAILLQNVLLVLASATWIV